jgi:CRP-like cAMP-binding protein
VPSEGDVQGVAEVVDLAFGRTRPETRRTLAAHAEVRTFRPRETVIPQGDESWVGLVLEGHAGLRRTTVDGREVITMIVSGGQLGPVMPIAGRPFTADLLALSAGRIALWPGSEVRALAAEDAGLGLDLLELVLLSVEEVVERMDGLLYQNAQRRVARILDQHAEIIFGEEAVVTRAYLPALVGTSREMTGRVLRQLEADGVVKRIGRHRLRLLDPARLARTAAPPAAESERDGRNKFLASPLRAMRE